MSSEVKPTNSRKSSSRKSSSRKKPVSLGFMRLLAHPRAFHVVIGSNTRNRLSTMRLPEWRDADVSAKVFAANEAILMLRRRGFVPIGLTVNLSPRHEQNLHPASRDLAGSDPLSSVRDLIVKAIKSVLPGDNADVFLYLVVHDTKGSRDSARISPHLHGVLAIPDPGSEHNLSALEKKLEESIRKVVASRYKVVANNKAVLATHTYKGKKADGEEEIRLIDRGYFDYIFDGSKSYFGGPVSLSQALTREARQLWGEWRKL